VTANFSVLQQKIEQTGFMVCVPDVLQKACHNICRSTRIYFNYKMCFFWFVDGMADQNQPIERAN
jgi:hypothetical protein